jgi:hypothetical protein
VGTVILRASSQLLCDGNAKRNYKPKNKKVGEDLLFQGLQKRKIGQTLTFSHASCPPRSSFRFSEQRWTSPGRARPL